MGCASQPAAPFNTLPEAQLTAYHLQNTPQQGQQQPGAPAIPGIPGITPEMIRQTTQQIESIIPGISGIVNQVTGGAATGGGQSQAPRFPLNFPPEQSFEIKRQQVVIDASVKERLAEILGDADNFEPERYQGCVAPEIGFSFSSAPGQPTNDVMVSFVCHSVKPANFTWPHPNFGMTQSTEQEMLSLMRDVWQ